MELMKKHKLHILVPVILVALSLVGSMLYALIRSSFSAQSHVSLGRQYLNELDYASAVLEFSNAIQLDPTDLDARIGLAETYAQSGSYDFAVEVLESAQDQDGLEPELAQALIQIHEDAGRPGAAIRVIGELIDRTDDEACYTQMNQAMEKLYSIPRTYAIGTDQELCISGGVLSRGSNTLGQLGTDQNLGRRQAVQEAFQPSGFPGKALSVCCAGRTSCVIDEDHNLWAAGENRWGQMGLAYSTALPEDGWVKLTDTGDVAAVAGGNGTLALLKLDGSLWACGSGIGQKPVRSAAFPHVLRIAWDNGTYYVLNRNGRLYSASSLTETAGAYCLAEDVIDFTAADGRVYWLRADGALGSSYGFNAPSGWTWDNSFCKPDLQIRTLAANGSCLVFWLQDGTLKQLDENGLLSEVPASGAVTALFTEKSHIVAALADGSVLCWPPRESAPRTGLPEYGG